MNLPGLNLSSLSTWFRKQVPTASLPLRAVFIPGGRSNLTFLIQDVAGVKWVLRRPPLGHLLPSAHDMGREYRIISALSSVGMPVPSPVAICADESIIGRQFYVMGFVEGSVLRRPQDTAQLSPSLRGELARELVERLVQLHSLDPDVVGLGNLGRREDYVSRQLHRWRRQIKDIQTPTAANLRTICDALALAIPPQDGVSIVHGDYRLDNIIVDSAGRVAAILDWELSTLGDPRADIGALITYWAPSGTPLGRMFGSTEAEGFPTRDDLTVMYRTAGGTTTSIDYFIAFAHWRLAAILEGVYDRFLAGAYGDDESDYNDLPEVLNHLSELLATMVREL